MFTSASATSRLINPFPLKPKLYTSAENARESMLVNAVPGREATPPCAIDVPYHTIGFFFGTASGTRTAPLKFFGIGAKRARSGLAPLETAARAA